MEIVKLPLGVSTVPAGTPVQLASGSRPPVGSELAQPRRRTRQHRRLADPGREPATDDGELERRVDQAPAVARASESAALEIGAAAIDAAEQARRAAELASEWVAAQPANGGADLLAERPDKAANGAADQGDEVLRHFTERADRQSLVLPSWNGRRPLS